MPTLNSKYAKHLKAVDGSMDGFAEIMESIMNDVLNKIDGYARQFLEAGNLSASQVLEAVQNNQIREDILTMLRESGFEDAADLYVNNWDELSIDGLSDVFETADIPLSFTSSDLDLMNQLQDFNINKALDVERALAQNLQSSIADMALGGASWEDTFPELKKRVDIDVHKNLKAQLNTGLSIFDQTVSNEVMEEAGVTKYEYYGPPPERSFCKHVMRVQSASDFKGWTKAKIESLASRSDWQSSAAGLGSPFTARGGWNCTHSWGMFIGDDVIDEDIAEKIKAPKPVKSKPTARAEPTRKPVKSEKAAEKATNDYIKKASKEELTAVNVYTGRKYKPINDSLISGKIPKDLQVDIDNINKFIDNSARFEGKVTRGMSFDNQKQADKFLKGFKDGDIVNNKSYWSTSTNKDISDGFLFDKEIPVQFEIQSKNGAWLNGTSQSVWEKEVLFKPNSQFKVVKKFKDKDTTIIRLLEL